MTELNADQRARLERGFETYVALKERYRAGEFGASA
jgi:hypothetical protein